MRKILSVMLFLVATSLATPTRCCQKIVQVTPETIEFNDLATHQRIAIQAFFEGDSKLLPTIDKQDYDDWYSNAYKEFMLQKNGDFLLSAYTTNNQLVGGIYCKIIRGPQPVFGLADHEIAYYLNLLYVDPLFQKKGIASQLLVHLIKLSETSAPCVPIFLYTYAENTISRKMYEKYGFTLIADQDHPDGCWTHVAKTLSVLSNEFDPINPVAYVRSH